MSKTVDKRVLIIAAHPDDEVLGCGGVIARYRMEDVPVRVVFLAEGVMARYEPSEFNSPKVIEESDRRNNNAYRALQVLGVPKENIIVSKRPCCRLDQVPLIDLVKEIERHIHDFRPTLIFTHASEDTNIDHVIAYRAALSAIRPVGDIRIKAAYSFEVLSSTEWNPLKPFIATSFFEISGVIDKKIDALRAYEGEMRDSPHPRSEEVVRGLASFRGAQAGVSFAEGFQLIRSVDL